MAHTISAKKRIRQAERRTTRNRARTSRIRTFVRKVEEAVRSGDKNAAEAAYKAMMPELHGRAARWHLAHGSIFDALGHAVAGRDWAFVGRLVVSQAAPLILSANRAALMKVLRAVPAGELSTTAELMVCGALMLFDAGDWDAIPARLEGARDLLRDRPTAERLPVEITIRSLEMSVRRAVGDLVHTFRATADQKRLSLDVDIDESVPDQMVTDEQRFHQVLRNLLSNALKFTEAGGVRVKVSRPKGDVDYSSPLLRARALPTSCSSATPTSAFALRPSRSG